MALPNSNHIAQEELSSNINKIPRDKPIVVYCHHGYRSQPVANQLQQKYGFEQVYNLEGGIDEWSVEIDNSLERY